MMIMDKSSSADPGHWRVALNLAVVLLAVCSPSMVQCQGEPKSIGNCNAAGASVLYCYGGRMLRTVLKQLANERSLQLMPGVEIVRLDQEEEFIEEYGGGDVDDNEIDGGGHLRRVSGSWGGVMNRVARYLTSHELKVNLGQLIGKNELRSVVRSTLNTVHEEMARELVGEAKGKKGKGYGAILMMGVMMSKLLGALGFGGVALLALKALGVSMMALLLSAILGLKKLADGGGGGGGHDHKGRQNQQQEEDEEEQYRIEAATEPMLMTTGGGSGPTGTGAGHSSYGDDSYQLHASGRRRRRRSPQKDRANSPYRGWKRDV